MIFFLHSLFLFSSLIIASLNANPTEGCKGVIQPPGDQFYENLYINQTFSKTIPSWAMTQMKEIVDTVSEMIISDFPADFTSSRKPNVYLGAAGRGFFCLRMYKSSGKEIWLHRAKEYIDYSLEHFTYSHDEKEILPFQKGRVGVVSLAAVIYDMLGKEEEVEKYLNEYDKLFKSARRYSYYDFESGLSGLIYSAQFLNMYFEKEIVSQKRINEILIFIFEQGWKYYNETTGALQWEYYRDHFWTGMGSHGSGSPLYTLLMYHNEIKNETIRKLVKSTVDNIFSKQTPSGQIPGDLEPDRTQWCHGIPGILPIFGLSYDIYKDEKYLRAGLLGTELISKIGILTKGMMFCHGVGGNVYMMLDFYKKTKKEEILNRVISMILTSLKTPELTNPDSWVSYDCLPEGMFVSSSIGMVLLFDDVLNHLNDLENTHMLSFHVSL